MKRLLVLLLVLAGGLVWAALAIPTNAAVVNGATISQSQLNSDVSTIAKSPYYQCYLNSQEYVSSQGSEALPSVTGAGTGNNPGDDPTATTAFTATYLDTKIGHEVVAQMAAQRGVVVTQAELTTARKAYEEQITEVMDEAAQNLQTASASQKVRFTCGAVQPLTGSQVLDTLPPSFVDEQVQFVATATVLQEDLSGVGSRTSDLRRYFESHLAQFDDACLTIATFTTESAAQAAQASVASGTPFSQVASASEGGGQQGCEVLYQIASQLPSSAKLDTLPLNTVSDPIAYNNSYFLIEITKRTPTAYSQVATLVAGAVQQAGAAKTQKAIDAAQRRSVISVDSRYGVWVHVPGTVLVPLTPPAGDVPNVKANEATTILSSSSASG